MCKWPDCKWRFARSVGRFLVFLKKKSFTFLARYRILYEFNVFCLLMLIYGFFLMFCLKLTLKETLVKFLPDLKMLSN